MKYLVTWKVNPVPPEMAKMALDLVKASLAQTDKDVKEGRITEASMYVDQSGGLVIVDVESNEELYQRLANEPFAPFLDFCVTPLIDYKIGYQSVISLFEKMAG